MQEIFYFITFQFIIVSSIFIYYVFVFRKSAQAEKERDEKRKVEFYNKVVTGTWEEGQEPGYDYKPSDN